MSKVTDEQVEAACIAFDPELFSTDAMIAQRAASPLLVESARAPIRERIRAALSASSLNPEAAPVEADQIVSALYRRFKEWSKRGFGPDDVTWCEVKAEVMALIGLYAHPDPLPKGVTASLLDPDMPAAELRLHMGEMTAQELRTARAAIRWANSRLSPNAGEIEAGGEGFQNRVAKAHHALFHDDPTDLAERRDRFGEEANELQQALGQTREAAHQLVEYTYDRPAGEPKKEIGAVVLTLASLCVIGEWDMMACAETDLAILQTPEKIAKVRAKRATRHGRGPLPGLDRDALESRQ